MTTPGSPSDGWYPDPRGGAVLRRWASGAWTEDTKPMPPPMPQPSPPAEIQAGVGWPRPQTVDEQPSPTRAGEEETVYTARVHPLLAFARPAFLSAVITLFSLAFGPVSGSALGLWLSLHLLASPWLLTPYLRWRNGKYELTSRRLVRSGGVISRHSTETLLAKVESVRVQQSGTGRLLGYGSVIVGGTGGHQTTFIGSRDPDAFRDAIQRQVEAVRGY